MILNQIDPQFHLKCYRLILYIGGIIVTSHIFKGLHDEVKGSAWLILPASTLEKFVSRLILLILFYPLGIILLVFLVSHISGYFNVLLIGASHGTFNPFDKIVLCRTGDYIVIQSLFLFGTIYFKRNPALTLLAIVGYLILLVFIARIFFMVIFSQYPDSFYDFFNMGEWVGWVSWIFEHEQEIAYKIIYWVFVIYYWCFIAPIFWLAGYFRLKEKEV
jgi:hypothetical protein